VHIIYDMNSNKSVTNNDIKYLTSTGHGTDEKKPVGKSKIKLPSFDAAVQAGIAGGISGGIEICITYPTEYVKTQLQLYEKISKQSSGHAGNIRIYKGPIDCAVQTVKEFGILGLYRGLSPLLYMSIPKAAVRFMAFEMCANTLKDDKGKLNAKANFFAGLGAGVIEAIFVVTPMETIKVKFIHDQTQTVRKYKGFFSGIYQIIKSEGISGTYKGLFPTILKQGSNQAIRFLCYSEIKKWMQGGDANKKLTPGHTMLAGALAGAASVFGNTPIDVVKTRMQGLESHRYKNSLDCTWKIMKNEGVKAFYKGTTPRLARVCADVAIVMTLYEQINHFIDTYIWKGKKSSSAL